MTDPPAFAFFVEISIIDQLAGTAFERALPKGMTRAQFGILNHFVRLELESQSPAALAAAFQVTRPTMTSTLARLERAGLISIAPDPHDGRAKLVAITAAGREMRQSCINGLARLLPAIASQASDDEYRAALPFLGKIRQALDVAR